MKNKISVVFLCFILSFTTLFASATPTQTIKPVDVHFISTGNSDAILISDNNKYMLIDGAENDDEKSIVDYLNNLKIKKLDYIVLTHPDADHCGGLDAVVRNFQVGNILIGNGSAETKTYKDFLQEAINKNLKSSVPLDNEFTLENGKFRFYNQKSIAKDVNDRSLVMLYTNGANKFLFTGDAGVDVERNLPIKNIGKVDVLKVGHHGSSTSSSDEFIKAIAPKYAVICCGKDNKYGHPHKATTDTLSKYKVTTYRTYLNGDIIVTSDGKDISVKLTTPANRADKASTSTTNKATNTTVKQPISTTQPITQTVYVTKTGNKYHKDGCSGLSKSKIAISLEEAKKKGYEACDRCWK